MSWYAMDSIELDEAMDEIDSNDGAGEAKRSLARELSTARTSLAFIVARRWSYEARCSSIHDGSEEAERGCEW